jgi:hypothetical protein
MKDPLTHANFNFQFFFWLKFQKLLDLESCDIFALIHHSQLSSKLTGSIEY